MEYKTELNVGELFHAPEEYGSYLGTNWQQGACFNALCPSGGSCTLTQAGCVAIAMAQVMKYHEYPSAFFTHTYKYAGMHPINGTSDSALLIADAGFAVSMNYGCSSSWSWFSNIAPALNGFGYTSAVGASYNFDVIYNNIRFGYPVILGADRTLFSGLFMFSVQCQFHVVPEQDFIFRNNLK